MEIKPFLKEYSEKIDDFLDEFFLDKVSEAKKIDPLAVDVVKTLSFYIKGGKKVRGGLTYLGYKIAGGKDDKSIVPVSAAVEIMHSAFLIHDDLINSDKMRRGKPTVHEIYAEGHSGHYGGSIALMIGDLGIFFANQIISSSKFPSQRINQAISKFQELLIKTGYGQILDIAYDFKKNISWEEIEKVRVYKTAYYTFIMPLQVGATLAGAKKVTFSAMKKYGVPTGIAFQLRDDILGIFGKAEITGKSTLGDITDGKRTFLFVKALELAGESDASFLKKYYGSKKLDAEKINKIKKIIEISGALDYSEKLCRKLVGEGKSFIPAITRNKNYQKILSSLADFAITRKK